jgi:hypothetical protein
MLWGGQGLGPLILCGLENDWYRDDFIRGLVAGGKSGFGCHCKYNSKCNRRFLRQAQDDNYGVRSMQLALQQNANANATARTNAKAEADPYAMTNKESQCNCIEGGSGGDAVVGDEFG